MAALLYLHDVKLRECRLHVGPKNIVKHIERRIEGGDVREHNAQLIGQSNRAGSQ